MSIEVAKTAGFCFGVNRAVQMVYDLIEAGESICTLGPIIHNPQLVEELAEKINKLGRSVIFLGDGVPVYWETLEKLLTAEHAYAPAHVNKQRAAAVAVLAQKYFREGKTEPAWEHQPVYLRMSQAEQERQRQNAVGEAAKENQMRNAGGETRKENLEG